MNWALNWTLNWAGHTGLDISILIVLVLVCRRPFANLFGARAAYALWVLPLLRLVLPEIPITLPRPSWLQATINAPTEIITAPIMETINSSPVAPQINWQLPIFALWLSVAVIWFVRQLWRQHQYMETVQKNSKPASRHVHNKTDEARKILHMKMAPNLRLSSTNVGPLVSGILKPIIILPRDFENDFTDRQQFFALTHELAHIKRGDLWAAFGALVFRALNWPNPLVHLCAAKFRIDQEAACDAYVLNTIGGGAQTKQNYAATLIHSAKLTRNSTRTPIDQAPQPLCLTIYHPLKERLMTLKTSKTGSTILSRIGVGAFLAAALAATAPISFAGDPEAPQTKTKRVMKWVENNDGIKTSKHIEITVEDGVTTAYSIDEHGNKTLIDASEIEMMEGMSDKHMTHMKHMKHMKIMKGEGGDHMLHLKDGANSQIIIKRMVKNADGSIIDLDNDFIMMGGDGNHAAAMVSAAQRLLDRAEMTTDGKELSSKTRKKLNKARKALKEAQEALEAEE